ncbi:MAG: hypothetical protein JWM96_836 [Alphaproteobacteria bacterium]|nr:hypothetical protein [Alphaproteobacteria bacterium]
MAMPIIPLWAVLSLAASLLVTFIPLVQERFKADGFALALWNKVFVAAMISPFLWRVGLPTDPLFYGFVTLTAAIFSLSDVVYFRAVPIIGSGLMTRLLPASVVITFLLWFAVDPQLIDKYTAVPWKMAAICAILLAFVFFASRVKKCHISWTGLRLIWPVIVAACIGPVLVKLALDHAAKEQATFAYLFFQSVLTIFFLSLYAAVKHPVPRRVLYSPHVIKVAALMGALMGSTMYLKTRAVALVDNPGFTSMIFFTDALWVILIYKLIGRKETGNIWAGLGIVACAAALVLVKSL